MVAKDCEFEEIYNPYSIFLCLFLHMMRFTDQTISTFERLLHLRTISQLYCVLRDEYQPLYEKKIKFYTPCHTILSANVVTVSINMKRHAMLSEDYCTTNLHTMSQ